MSSLRKFNPFSSRTNLNSDRESRVSRAPTFVSTFTAAPSYTTYASNPYSDHSGNNANPMVPSPSTGSSPGYDFFDETASSFADTASVVTSIGATAPSGPRYMYYRIFTETGPVLSLNPISSTDPYLARVLSKLVAPPHTAASIKRCLCKVEQLGDPTAASLFIAASSQNAMDDGGKVSILKSHGPGSIPQDPVALLIGNMTTETKDILDARVPAEGDSSWPAELEGLPPPQYVYYGLYDDDGAITSRHAVDSNDPFVGRININFVAPPHTALSLKRCISQAENINQNKNVNLFVDISGECPIDGRISILTTERPGARPDGPIAFVVSAQKSTTVAPPLKSTRSAANDPRFKKKCKTITKSGKLSTDPRFLAFEKDQVLRIDGVNRSEYNEFYARRYEVYEAVTASGNVGFIPIYTVKFI